MAFLVLRRDILAEVKRIVFRTPDETGVWLVGEIQDRCYVVRYVIGPGERAVHRRTFYQCDKAYAEHQISDLLKREPHLRLLGELHTHPAGNADLSSRDLATIRNVLREVPWFIAGTIQRRPFRISPALFTRCGRIRLTCVLR